MWTEAYAWNVTETEKIDRRGYAYIRSQILHTGKTPSLREIGHAVGYKSPRSVQLMLFRLERKGLISYGAGKFQLSLQKKPASMEHTVSVPLIGSVMCGAPSLAEESVEAYIHVSTMIARPGSQYFMLRAVGTSMNRSGIDDGDIILVRQQSAAEEGERVVALINDEATIKHFHHRGDVIVLRPNSTDPGHQPIIVTGELMVQGVVVAVFPPSIIN